MLMAILFAICVAQHAAEVTVNSGLAEPLQAEVPYSLNVTFANNSSPLPIDLLIASHERVLHVVIIGQDLDSFIHMHPEDFGFDAAQSPPATALPLLVTFPFPGNYIMAFDALATLGNTDNPIAVTQIASVDGAPTLVSTAVDLAKVKTFVSFLETSPPPWVSLLSLQHATSSAAQSQMPPDSLRTNTQYRMVMTGPDVIMPGQPHDYVFSVFNAITEAAVTDMTPYLGAQAHVSLIKHDMSYYAHEHAMGNLADMEDMGLAGDEVLSTHIDTLFGPSTSVELTLPSEGTYRMIVQMSRGLELLCVPFDVVVVASASNGSDNSSTPESSGSVGIPASWDAVLWLAVITAVALL